MLTYVLRFSFSLEFHHGYWSDSRCSLSFSLLYTIDLNLAPCVTHKKAQLLQQQRAAARAESPAAIQRDQKLGSRSDTLGHFT